MKKIAIVAALVVLAVTMVGCGDTVTETTGSSYNQGQGGGKYK